MIALNRFYLLASFLVLSGALLISALAPSPANAQERGSQFPRTSPNATVSQTIGVTQVRIGYSRPSVRGREIYGGLVPYDDVWRTGANEATTISFQHNVQIEGQSLGAGTYALFTIPGQDAWTIIFNRNENQWGAFNHDPSQDALRVEVTPTSTARQWEMMTFVFENVSDSEGQVALYWANTKVPFTITVDTPAILRAAGNDAARKAASWEGPYRYAAYALQNEMMLDDALTWIDQSIAMTATYNNLAVKARLLAATGNHSEAVSAGERAIQKGEAMDEVPRGLSDLKQQVESWKSEL